MADPQHNPSIQAARPRAESRYRQYWEEMPCYLSVHDREFRIVDGNRRFRDDFGQDLFFIRDAIPSLRAVRQRAPSRVVVIVNVERQGESVSMSLQVGYTPHGPDV